MNTKKTKPMKITIAKIKRELIKKEWVDEYIDQQLQTSLIKDILTIIDAELKAHKGISIK